MVGGTGPRVLSRSRHFRARTVSQKHVITDFRWLKLSRAEQTKLFDETQVFGFGPRICLGKEYVSSRSKTDSKAWQ